MLHSKHPLLYEINTWVWLGELGQNAAHPFTLATVPEKEWDRIADLGFDAVWLMGVWERSPESARISMANQSLCADFKDALPDFSEQDNIGSAYSIRRYVVDARLGGTEAMAEARRKLAERGMHLILDFVPNHVALDHPWVDRHPEYFVQGSREELIRDPNSFAEIGGTVFACGRDPHFPAWADVVQVNAFDCGFRSAIVQRLSEIADICDGVRCDMAMLLMNSIFEKTWGDRPGAPPESDFWPTIIPAVKKSFPNFIFIAEAYWGLEEALQRQGFDYCYDKELYDRLRHGSAEKVRQHLCSSVGDRDKLVRFVENHDEPRAAAIFDSQKHRAVAVATLTLPGARLVHEGQIEGRRIRLPVFLRRRPLEPSDQDLTRFYGRLFRTFRSENLEGGEWRLCQCKGWPDNFSHRNLISWSWKKAEGGHLIVVNLSDTPSQGRVEIPWRHLAGRIWRLEDHFTSEVFERNGDELEDQGLFVDLPAWGVHLLFCSIPE